MVKNLFLELCFGRIFSAENWLQIIKQIDFRHRISHHGSEKSENDAHLNILSVRIGNQRANLKPYFLDEMSFFNEIWNKTFLKHDYSEREFVYSPISDHSGINL